MKIEKGKISKKNDLPVRKIGELPRGKEIFFVNKKILQTKRMQMTSQIFSQFAFFSPRSFHSRWIFNITSENYQHNTIIQKGTIFDKWWINEEKKQQSNKKEKLHKRNFWRKKYFSFFFVLFL